MDSLQLKTSSGSSVSRSARPEVPRGGGIDSHSGHAHADKPVYPNEEHGLCPLSANRIMRTLWAFCLEPESWPCDPRVSAAR
uniref:Uncharacterized protein n=1 Tax=Bionectria ochroleuca TaxID=29856 RepID=A0A0B7KP52_BIOOC